MNVASSSTRRPSARALQNDGTWSVLNTADFVVSNVLAGDLDADGHIDADDIDAIVFQNLAKIFFKLRFFSTLPFGNFFRPPTTNIMVRIANVKNLGVFSSGKCADVAAAPTFNTNNRDAEFSVRALTLFFGCHQLTGGTDRYRRCGEH